MLDLTPANKPQEPLKAKSPAFHIKLNPGKLLHSLALVVLCLLVMHLVGQFSKYVLSHGTAWGLVPLFDVAQEGNVPTWFSSSILLVCSLLLSIITIAKGRELDRYTLYWGALAVFFLFISMDETARIHELLILPVRSSLNVTGFLYYAWVIPYGIMLLTLVLLYLRFFFALPRRTRLLFLVAGATYASGALGLELIEGYIDARIGMDNITMAALTTCEELQEMGGMIIFVYTLLSYMAPYSKEIVITIRGEEPGS